MYRKAKVYTTALLTVILLVPAFDLVSFKIKYFVSGIAFIPKKPAVFSLILAYDLVLNQQTCIIIIIIENKYIISLVFYSYFYVRLLISLN